MEWWVLYNIFASDTLHLYFLLPFHHYNYVLREPIFLSASLILLIYLISYFSHFCTLLYAGFYLLVLHTVFPLYSLFFFCLKPCGFPGFLSGCWLLCCFSAFLHVSFYFGFWLSCLGLVYVLLVLYHSMFIILMQSWYYFIYFESRCTKEIFTVSNRNSSMMWQEDDIIVPMLADFENGFSISYIYKQVR